MRTLETLQKLNFGVVHMVIIFFPLAEHHLLFWVVLFTVVHLHLHLGLWWGWGHESHHILMRLRRVLHGVVGVGVRIPCLRHHLRGVLMLLVVWVYGNTVIEWHVGTVCWVILGHLNWHLDAGLRELLICSFGFFVDALFSSSLASNATFHNNKHNSSNDQNLKKNH